MAGAKAVLVVAVAALALAAAASAALSPAAYRTQAAKACGQTKLELARAAKGRSSSDASLRRFLVRAVPIGRRYLGRIRALDPPARFAATHRRILALVAREVARLRADLAAVRSGRSAREILDDPVEQKLSDEENAAWKKLSVVACAS